MDHKEYNQEDKIEKFIKFFTKMVMKSFGILLSGCFALLVTLIFYSFVYDICKQVHFAHENYLYTFVIFAIGLYLAFNIVFNFAMAILVDPGSTEDFPTIYSDDDD